MATKSHDAPFHDCSVCGKAWPTVLDPRQPQPVWKHAVDVVLHCTGDGQNRHLALLEGVSVIANRSARLAYRLGIHPDQLDPDGIADEALVELLGRCRHEPITSPFGWLKAKVHCLLIDEIRRQKRHAPFDVVPIEDRDSELTAPEDVPVATSKDGAPFEDPDTELSAPEDVPVPNPLLAPTLEAMRRLTDDQRAALEAAADNRPASETAKERQCKPDKVRKDLQRAREKVRSYVLKSFEGQKGTQAV